MKPKSFFARGHYFQYLGSGDKGMEIVYKAYRLLPWWLIRVLWINPQKEGSTIEDLEKLSEAAKGQLM